MEILKDELIEILTLHLVVIVFGLSLFVLPVASGWVFFITVCIYNIVIPIWANYRNNLNLFDIWLYSFLLSNLQVIPDWILSSLLNVLVFPPDGFIRIGSVSGYMLGLWTIPFVMIIYISAYINDLTKDYTVSALFAGCTAFTIFGISEMTLWRLGSWYAQGVGTTFHVAHYIIIPEMLLGMAVYLGYSLFRTERWYLRYLTILTTMVVYTGSVIISYFFVEFIP